MTDTFSQVPPNSTGKKIRLFENTVGPDDVSSEATTITDQTGQVMKDMGAAGRVFVDASEVAIPVTDNGGSLTVDGVFFQATQPVSGTVTANAGTGPWPVTDNGGSLTVDGTVAATQSGTWTVQPGNTANTTPWLVTSSPGTSGGYLISRRISTASTNAVSAKASAGQVYGYYIYNDSNQTRYVKLYNKASAPTVGTDIPVMTIPIPGGSAANVDFSNGIAFATGIAFAMTTGMADTDTGAVAANEVVLNLFYK